MNQTLVTNFPQHKRTLAWVAGSSVIAALLGAAVMYQLGEKKEQLTVPNKPAQQISKSNDLTEPAEAIVLPKAKWNIAGIELATAESRDVDESIWVTGKVALNEDRLAQIDPLVEGIVHEVKVQFGDDVQAGQVLAIIDSREIGLAKLELFKNRQATRLATTEAQWQREVETNTQLLIAALKEQIPIAEIEERFTDKAMGSYREQLVSAYARLHKSRADYERLEYLKKQKIAAGKDFIAAKAAYEADQAMLQALLEQIRFTSRQARLAADQSLEQTHLAESISETNLRILGLGELLTADFDPTQEGEAVSHYSINAPFDGTIIAKDVVLLERVGPTTQIFTIANLSSVWVTADIYERNMALLAQLSDKTLRFRSGAYPDRMFEATVFFTGSLVSEQSRTLPMMALADNAQRLLKPGMFVEVELPQSSVKDLLIVPKSALQEHEGEPFVFIQQNGETFSRRDVTLGRSFDDVVEIIAGVQAGETVVAEGGFFLKSQMLGAQLADED